MLIEANHYYNNNYEYDEVSPLGIWKTSRALFCLLVSHTEINMKDIDPSSLIKIYQRYNLSHHTAIKPEDISIN